MIQMNAGFPVTCYGAVGDGQTLNTAAIQAAIDACAHAGGGTVYIPAGLYLTGSLSLHSNITLYLDAGATLRGSSNLADYALISSRWEGAEITTHAPLIGGRDLKNIAVLGRGTIDGNGSVWWKPFREGRLEHPRPRLISFEHCNNILIAGITAVNSPSWTIHPLLCDNVTVDHITIVNPADSPNTDGINPDSSRNVHISNCHVDVGDDCVTIKSGTEEIGADRRAPCENITITNCTMVHGHGGVTIGSEMSGGVRRVVISNCVFVGTDRGIRMKSRRGRGGVVEDIRASNIVMTDVLCPITMNLIYAVGRWGDLSVCDPNPQPITAGTPCFRNIYLCQISVHSAKYSAGFIHGLPEQPIENLSLSDISITMAEEAEPGYPEMADGLEPVARAGLTAQHVRDLRLHNLEIRGQQGPALLFYNVHE